MTPTRIVSFAPNTRVEASAVSPLGTMKLRRLIMFDRASVRFGRNDPIKFRSGQSLDERNSRFRTSTPFTDFRAAFYCPANAPPGCRSPLRLASGIVQPRQDWSEHVRDEDPDHV